MPESLSFLTRIDLGGGILTLLDLIERADLCFAGLIVGVLVSLGWKMAAGNKTMMVWGPRLAVVAFLIHGGVALHHTDDWETLALVRLGARSAILAGAVLAISWIILPILLFVYAHLRLALAAFFLYSGYALVTAPEWSSEMLPGIAARGLIAAALGMVVAWIFQPFVEMLFPPRTESAAKTSMPDVADEQAARRSKRRRRKWAMLRRAWNDVAEGEEESLARVQIEMRRRRDQARLTVEMTYVTAFPELGQQFPREWFENWLNRYLGDHLPPDEVEENSRQLQRLLAQRLSATPPTPRASPGGGPSPLLNLDELNQWMRAEQNRIQMLPLDPQEKQAKLLNLHELYFSLLNRLLEEPARQVIALPFPEASPSQAEAR